MYKIRARLAGRYIVTKLIKIGESIRQVAIAESYSYHQGVVCTDRNNIIMWLAHQRKIIYTHIDYHPNNTSSSLFAKKKILVVLKENFQYSPVPNYPNYRLFQYFYVHNFCYVSRCRCIQMHSKNYISRETKRIYNLKRRKQFLKEFFYQF